MKSELTSIHQLMIGIKANEGSFDGISPDPDETEAFLHEIIGFRDLVELRLEALNKQIQTASPLPDDQE